MSNKKTNNTPNSQPAKDTGYVCLLNFKHDGIRGNKDERLKGDVDADVIKVLLKKKFIAKA